MHLQVRDLGLNSLIGLLPGNKKLLLKKVIYFEEIFSIDLKSGKGGSKLFSEAGGRQVAY